MFKKNIVILTVFTVIVFAGCQPRTQQSPNPAAPQNFQKSGQVPGGTNMSISAPPAEIESIRAQVFSIMTDINNKNWARAKSRISTLKTDVNQLRTAVGKLGNIGMNGTPNIGMGKTGDGKTGMNGIVIGGTGNQTGAGTRLSTGGTTSGNLSVTNPNITQMNTNLNNLQSAVNSKKAYDAKVCANQILKNLVDTSKSYNNPRPVEIGTIEYLCNQIMLDAEKRDWNSASSNLKACKDAAAALKTKLNGISDNNLTGLNNNLDKLTKAVNSKNARETSRLAQSCLDNVQGYRRAP